MKEEFKVAEDRIRDLQLWYVDVIYAAADKAGGKTKLARALGRDNSFVHVTLARQDFGALRECVRRIVEKKLI